MREQPSSPPPSPGSMLSRVTIATHSTGVPPVAAAEAISAAPSARPKPAGDAALAEEAPETEKGADALAELLRRLVARAEDGPGPAP